MLASVPFDQSGPLDRYRRWVILRDGGRILMRAVRPADKEAVRELFARLTPETRFLRFHHYKPGLTEEEADYFCDVDQENHVALVAVLPRRGRDEIVGIGRFCRLVRGDAAEVSFIVEDAEQGRGIGTALLEVLAGLAQERGVRSLVAEVLLENTVMMQVFRRYDPDLQVTVDGNSFYVTFSPWGAGSEAP